MTAQVTNLHDFYGVCSECGWDTWYMKMTPDKTMVDGFLCANPECDNFVDNDSLAVEIELD